MFSRSGPSNGVAGRYGAQQGYGAQSYGAGAPVTGNDLTASGKPKKFKVINGVMKRNPEYDRYMQSQGNTRPEDASVFNNQLALPVVANMEEHEAFNEAYAATTGIERPLAESTNATIEMMQEPEISMQVGLDGDQLIDQLGEVFAKNEIPMGLMNKLYMLSEYDKLEFIIDDSGSMRSTSDTRDKFGNKQTRFEEAQGRLKDLMEILAYVPTNEISVTFFNRSNTVNLKRTAGETPEQFIQRAHRDIDRAFGAEQPLYRTPALKTFDRSFQSNQGKSVARYFFCDGVPDGGDSEVRQIEGLIKERANAQQNPITFMSCSEQDSDVEWMKELEEVAPFSAEYDDYASEAKEVLGDQGKSLPFTRGFYLVAQLVAAINPDDLDAMDESVPFTKTTLDNLLGYQTNEQEYQQYFRDFQQAQNAKRPQNQMDRIKTSMNWAQHYNEFLQAPLARQIPAVQDFKQRLTQAGGGNQSNYGGAYGHSQGGSYGSTGYGGYQSGGYGANQTGAYGGGNQHGGRRGLGGLFGRRV